MPNINCCDLLLKCVLSHLPSDPGLLIASKRYPRGDNATRVYPYGTCLEFVRRLDSSSDILAENVCSKTIYRVVGLLDNVFIMKKGQDGRKNNERIGIPCSSSNLITAPTGPNISSFTIFMLALTSVKSVGLIK